jgi:lysozyme
MRNGRHLAYQDIKDIWTVGYGRNLLGAGLSPAEADLLLDNDIDAALRGCRLFFPWFATLDEVRQQVLVEMAFNLGLPRLLRFERMLAALERHDYATAAQEARRSQWARQVKGRADTLATMLETGAA